MKLGLLFSLNLFLGVTFVLRATFQIRPLTNISVNDEILVKESNYSLVKHHRKCHLENGFIVDACDFQVTL